MYVTKFVHAHKAKNLTFNLNLFVPKPGARSTNKGEKQISETFFERHCELIEEKNMAELIIKYASL